MAVDPTGKFAYVANWAIRSGSNVSAYSIGANGASDAVPGSPFAAGARPSPWPGPDGKFAYVANPTTTTSRPTASVPTGP